MSAAIESWRDRVVYDAGAMRRLPQVLERLGHRRVLLVTGKASFEASGAADVLPDLRGSFDVERWSDFAANTDSADLVHGLDVVRSFDPDVIVGIGGGSPMDMAKLLVAYDEVGDDVLLDAIRAGGTIGERRRGLVLAPTTSGSGSEATHFAVVYIGDDKFSIAGPALRADAIVLDPTLAMSGSDHQRATSGVDALCQSIESLWAVAATDESRRYARYGLYFVSRHLRDFVRSPDITSARGMCIGSHLAGRAIDISKTTAAHALSYAITKRYGIEHGNAVALTLGAFVDAHSSAGHDSLHPTVNHDAITDRIRTIRARLVADESGTASDAFTRLLDDLGLPSTLDAAGLRTIDDMIEIVDTVNVERLGNNPVLFDADGLLSLFSPALRQSG